MYLLGDLAAAKGDLAAAMDRYCAAEEIRTAVLPSGHPDLGLTWWAVGLTLLHLASAKEAREIPHRTHSCLLAAFGAGDRWTRDVRGLLS
ncbi:hypothetical protein [Pseudonocardia sp. WMMC193]|uniref:hypothetical protein n=1 Tax=Pseudonocardia sp. WMMC193 TaxID=2911965 RepID=UPI001F2A9B68|nr:hypothetical protein [Pseudonocardia sp. WMMC193]MCF7553826.1 hypothetical protein [Pseudonocardia sp. WMMC193]